MLLHDDTSTDSVKVGGKLKLRANPYALVHRKVTEYYYDPRFQYWSAPWDSTIGIFEGAASNLPSNPIMSRLRNEALARFTGKVRKHNASLGVTFGSMGQTMSMITDRTHKISDILTGAIKRADRLSPAQRRRVVAKNRAGDVLEWEFGWMPLVQDIQAGFDTLANPTPPGYTKARSKTAFSVLTKNVGSAYAYDRLVQDSGFAQVSIGAIVDVTNPNVWLANRLGLLNLPGVAWDLIPWSFVANMFGNFAQMINSLTDFYGLTLRDGSVTYLSVAKRDDTCVAGIAPGQFKTIGSAHSNVQEKLRWRTVGGVPTPSFQWKVPQMNLELAVIAASLMVQKLDKLNKLFGFTVK